MISRREIFYSGLCVAAAGVAYELKPRRHVTLLGKKKMGAVLPISFGAWVSNDVDSLVKPETAGKLAARLYSEIVGRVYRHTGTAAEVMMLVAYGDTQSDLLQLHRPEVCYPAVGFNLLASVPTAFPIGPRGSLPGRHVVAEKSDRVENVAYWTRLGEYLPVSEGQQREARFKNAVQGTIPDGALFRVSMVGADSPASFRQLDEFISSLVLAVPRAERRALVGTELAQKTA